MTDDSASLRDRVEALERRVVEAGRLAAGLAIWLSFLASRRGFRSWCARRIESRKATQAADLKPRGAGGGASEKRTNTPAIRTTMASTNMAAAH